MRRAAEDVRRALRNARGAVDLAEATVHMVQSILQNLEESVARFAPEDDLGFAVWTNAAGRWPSTFHHVIARSPEEARAVTEAAGLEGAEGPWERLGPDVAVAIEEGDTGVITTCSCRTWIATTDPGILCTSVSGRSGFLEGRRAT